MPNQFFRFKQFAVRQERSAMKVGTDGVLLGAWANIGNTKRVLDVGTGTGLIALMIAQRSAALIDAVEIDENSALQAIENVKSSRWSERIKVYNKSFQDFTSETINRYDLIVSNPPYFVNSLKSEEVARMVARHNEQLSHSELLYGVSKLLTDHGRFVGIFPYVEGNIFVAEASKYGLFCISRVSIHGKVNGPIKRVMLNFSRHKQPLEESVLSIRGFDSEYTPEYVQLTKDFYLAF
jgi:tRNA1Val (adenine37-N6)-methyltransferase